jgi:hypothetical protein
MFGSAKMPGPKGSGASEQDAIDPKIRFSLVDEFAFAMLRVKASVIDDKLIPKLELATLFKTLKLSAGTEMLQRA